MRNLVRSLGALAVLFVLVALLSPRSESGTTLTGQLTIPSPTMVTPGAILSGQALRVGESITNTFNPAVSGLQRPVGSFAYTRDGTIAYVKVGSASTNWELLGLGAIAGSTTSYGQLAARASALTGTSPLTCDRQDFIAVVSGQFSDATTGTGSIAAVLGGTTFGGHFLLSTGATAASTVRRGTSTDVLGRIDTNRGYLALRYAVSTAVDAQTIVSTGLGDNGGAGLDFGVGICGATSTGFYVVNYDNSFSGSCVGTKFTTTVAVSTVQHLWELWFAGDSKMHVAVDGSEISSSPFTLTGALNISTRLWFQALNQATAAARTIDLDFYQACWVQS